MKWPRGWSNALGRWRKVLEAKLCRRLLEAEKGKGTDSPLQPPAGARPGRHLGFGVLTSGTVREHLCLI